MIDLSYIDIDINVDQYIYIFFFFIYIYIDFRIRGILFVITSDTATQIERFFSAVQ